jgi:hypothetical protein
MQQAPDGVAADREHAVVEEFGVVGRHDEPTLSLSTATRHRTQPTATVGALRRATTTAHTVSRGLFLQHDGLPADSFHEAYDLP